MQSIKSFNGGESKLGGGSHDNAGAGGTTSDSSSDSSSTSTTSSDTSSSSTSTTTNNSGGGQTAAHAGHGTSGSSSTTTPANNQSTVAVSSPNYGAALGYSNNSLTQGAGAASNVSASNVQQSQNTTGQANVTTMGVKPYAGQSLAVWQTDVGQQQKAMLVAKYGESTAQRLIEQTYFTQQEFRTKFPATNTDNQYLQNENRAITNAEKRQADFVNTNKFVANPQDPASAPIPNTITVSTPLYQQAGEKENPLTILEGNKFVSPSQQFLPQVNEEFAPRPAYSAFQNNPYIGVHQNSEIAPNSESGETQQKGVMDWINEIRQHKYFPFAIIGIVVIIALSLFGGAKAGRATRGGKGIFRSGGGSGQPIITVVK